MLEKVVIIAGPSRTGETTHVREILPHEAKCMVFVNGYDHGEVAHPSSRRQHVPIAPVTVGSA